MADLTEDSSGDRSQALARRRQHVLEDQLTRRIWKRNGWTKYPKSPVQFRSIGGFLVLCEPSTCIGQNDLNFSLTMKTTLEPNCSLKQDTEA